MKSNSEQSSRTVGCWSRRAVSWASNTDPRSYIPIPINVLSRAIGIGIAAGAVVGPFQHTALGTSSVDYLSCSRYERSVGTAIDAQGTYVQQYQ